MAPGEGFDLLDLRSGDRVTVRERAGSNQLTRGEAIFARVIPDGVGFQLTTGAVPIPVQHRASLLAFLDTEPSAVEICSWMAALEAPPTLLTMEVEPTVFCTVEYAIDDHGQAAAALRDETRRPAAEQLAAHRRSQADESIPIFGGLTPRQALEDPTRRGQLLAFLAEMEREEVTGSMSARRIRQLLGIGLL